MTRMVSIDAAAAGRSARRRRGRSGPRRRRPGARLPDDDARRRRPRRHPRQARGQRSRRPGHARRHRLGLLTTRSPSRSSSFPTSVQNVVWTQSAHEGKPFDESITFSSAEGVNVNADIGLSLPHRAALAPKLYGALPPERSREALRRLHAQHRARGVQRRRVEAARAGHLRGRQEQDARRRDAEVPRRLRQGRHRHRPAHDQRRRCACRRT